MIDLLPGRCRALLLPLAILCVLRLVGFAWLYARDSLQVDFAAVYHAGASMRAGLDPYDNNVAHDVALWDGVATFGHSRFLYPPIVAYVFQAVAAMPYPVAKVGWTFASLAILAACIILAARTAGLKLGAARWALATIIASLMFPLLPFLERGQIDAFTLLVISLGFYLALARGRDFAGGAVMAVAGFIKIQCFYLWPMLLIARRPRAAAGMAVAALALLLLQVALCGWPLTKRYVSEDLPRIARFGEVGSPDMRIPVPPPPAPGEVMAGGQWRYRYTLIPDYAAMSSLVPYVRGVIGAVGPRPPTPAVSIPLLLLALTVMWQPLRAGVGDEPWARLGFMHACLIVILLTAPITWTTNLAWLAPLALVIVLGPEMPEAKRLNAAAVAGLFLLLIPDAIACPFLLPRLIDPASREWVGGILGAQYLLALILLLPYMLRLAPGARSDGKVSPS